MKIEARLEQSAGGFYPVIFFPDCVAHDKTIEAYTPTDGHTTATRAYMRQCKKPESPQEYAEVFDCLAQYFTRAARYAAKR